jgi:hypothetical protein|tara:strand:- start:53 stop:511 length:459 start_codon:yes stop_codon:yes gene_type:complete
MTLKELQQLIKEEFEALTADSEISEADDLDVNVDADEVAAEKNPEDTLKRVFDMLKDYFEGEEEENVEDEVGEDMMDEVKDDETKNEEADLEERAAQGFGDPGAKNTHGKDAGYTPAKVTRGDGKLHEEDSKEEETKSALQERFQKLANIIK